MHFLSCLFVFYFNFSVFVVCAFFLETFLFLFIIIIGYPCHRSFGPAGDSVNPHPNSPVTEAGPRYCGGYLTRLDRIQWSDFVLVLTSTVAPHTITERVSESQAA
jgi:hypothetical protein